MNELDQMQNLLEYKIKQISDLKQALQSELSSLERKPKHIAIIKQSLESLVLIIRDFKSIFKQTQRFFQQDMFSQLSLPLLPKSQSSSSLSKEQTKWKQQYNKIKFELEQQIRLNDLNKQEVLDLKQMINLHIQKSKKQLEEKDSIIKQLKSKQLHNNNSDDNTRQQLIMKQQHLQTINEEQQINFTSRVFNYQQNVNFKITRQSTIINVNEQPDPNILSVVERESSSKRTIQSKTRARFFIDDFRNVVENTNQVSSVPDSFTRDKYETVEIDYSEMSEPISMFQFGRIMNPYHTISVQDKQNRDKTDRISVDFSVSESREGRSRSKEKKIQLTHIQKTPQLKVKDSNIVYGSRQRQGQKCSRFEKKERDSQKRLRVVSIQKKKGYAQSRNTYKWIRDTLQKVDIYVGDKRTQQTYTGQTKGRVRQGYGKLQYINGLIYEGQFKDNTRHGQGILSLNGNQIYQGQWQRDKLCGKGIIHNIPLVNKRKIPETSFLKSKSSYSGQFKDNSFHGTGIWIINSCEKFESLFNHGLPEGEFKYKKQNIDLFSKYGDLEIGNSYNSILEK